MNKLPHLLGVILAGGQSRRMGTDKLFVELDGKPLISHAVERLKAQMEHIVIVAPPKKRASLRFKNVSVISDNHEGFQGPLAGIFAGLSNAEIHGFYGIITIAADTPFFPDDYALRIAAEPRYELPGQERATIARTANGLHPVFGYWPLRAIEGILNLLDNDTRKVMAAADKIGWDPIDFKDAVVDPFFNINTPEELEQAQKIVRR